MIYPLKKRRFLPVFALFAFVVLSVMLRFSSSILTLLDAVVSIGIQAVATSKIGGLLIPAYFFKNFWVVWIAIMIWAVFLRLLGFKVGFWWSLASASILIVITWGWSLLTFFYWDGGPIMVQNMPAVANVLWAFLFYQIQQILVVRLPLLAWVKQAIGALMVIAWLFMAAASIVEYDLSATTLVGSALFGYAFFRVLAMLYIRQGKRWQQFFGVDGKI
ncbi:hypothetical protein LQZ24_03840 [Fructobacillus sp. M1-13]|uniref:Uncharacterized protein n=1 Tax=Fructobacillus papyriferae TaxID=2713171 RepID=A0ABS5QS71_9LACO|nr:hypothetical protein [Fructobacillus papyriferae]MBS9335174.1 hypothetical protein [Fructobacillus papyriferae]MCD2159157.1 hypothetical protein [Fructobacillus papyriferae]